MFIIIGLGNPGQEYKNTRHNAGFTAVDEIASNFKFPIFSFQSKFNAEISKGEIEGKKILLVKPQTYMNESGKSAQKILSSIKDQVSDIIIIHDDIDLPVGRIKISKERGSAGHKGVESIIKSIGNKGLIRIRIGIDSSVIKTSENQAKNIVLKNFSQEEQLLINEAISVASKAISVIINEKTESAMNKFN